MQNQLNKSIAIITSSPMSINFFLRDQINELSKLHKVTIITNLNIKNENLLYEISPKIEIISVPIKREIKILSDFRALIILIKIFYFKKFNIIHSISPKAGFISMLSGWITRTPIRLHTFTGQVWVTKKGVFRFILKLIDSIIVKLSTKIIVDSFSQKEFLINEGVLKEKNYSLVLGNGSISGVDLKRFYPDKIKRAKIRNKFNIKESDFLVLYLGRLKVDKGILDLIKAFKILKSQKLNSKLIIVGPDEDNIKNKLIKQSSSLDGINFIPLTKKPEHFMMASDIFVLPSYREGFGSSIIEAAACGIPAVASNIYGLRDAVKNYETGLLFEPKSINQLSKAMLKLALDIKLCDLYGRQALLNAKKLYSQEILTNEIINLYASLLQNTKKELI